MSIKLTPQAIRAIQKAEYEARRCRDSHLAPEHLLLALMAQTNNAASRMLRESNVEPASIRSRLERYLSRSDDPAAPPGRQQPQGISPQPAPVRDILPRMTVVLDQATEAARSMAAPGIGTEHLLLGILQEGKILAALLLRRHGLHPIPLTALLKGRIPEARWRTWFDLLSPAEFVTTSMAVRAVAGLALLTCWWLILWLALVAAMLAAPLPEALQAAFVRNGWALIIAYWSVPRGLRLERSAWPKMQALLFAASAGAAGLLAATACGLCPRLASAGVQLCFYTLAVTAIAATLFRHRADFGVETRAGWRTLRQEGGWILAVSGALELAALGGWILFT